MQNINMDFSQAVRIDTQAQQWQPSPRAGVWRKPLAREQRESGHATSIVRYEPGASFHSHNHPGGEEILVLEGTFSDETGDFGRGTYFRNPAGFVHAPFSKEGCVILVKLHQFQDNDRQRLSIVTQNQEMQSLDEGVSILPLHRHGSERVSLMQLQRGAELDLSTHKGLEWYLLSGGLEDAATGALLGEAGTWSRAPAMEVLRATTDTSLWLKSGHF